jgi:5'-3' exonuclease
MNSATTTPSPCRQENYTGGAVRLLQFKVRNLFESSQERTKPCACFSGQDGLRCRESMVGSEKPNEPIKVIEI